MDEQLRVVIAERPRLTWGVQGPEQVIYHLPDGHDKDDGWWQPIKCGGGICLHGSYERVPLSHVCADCRANRKTM